MPKLIFAGLDAAGKTTIYKHTIAELNVEESVDSKPTRGIDRHVNQFLDVDFSVWDLGGQKSYRETYLSRPEVFNATKAVIFVVDIQDTERFEESYQYYLDIMNIVMNIDPRPKVYVLFHKFDPQLSGKLRSHFFRATKLFRQADKIGGIKFTGFATSIYSDTIQKAVKRILWENMEGYEPSKETTKPSSDSQEDTTAVPKIGAPAPAVPKTSPQPVIPKPMAKELDKSLEKEMDTILSSIDEIAAKAKKMQEEKEKASNVTEEVIKETPKPPQVSEAAVAKPEVEESTPAVEIPKPEASSEPVESKVYEEVPNLKDLSQQVVDKLSAVVQKRMNETEEIVAIAILGLSGDIPLAVAKSEVQKEKLEIVRNVVSSLNPKQFFKDLGDVEYRGLGHLQIADFDIYFARLTDENAIAILAVDVSTNMLENAQRIVKTLRQGLGMGEKGDLEEEDQEEEPDKEDLIGDLRARLSRISSLHSVDE